MARRKWLAAWVSLGVAQAGVCAAWAQTLCNGHGSFTNGVCTCATGYAGTSCNQCATNYVGYPNCGSICGDVNDDGAVDPNDVTLFRAHLASPTGSPFSAKGAAKCTVAPLVPTLPPCDILDVVVIRRSVQSPPLLPPRGPDCPFVSGCSPGAPGCGWSDGDEITYPQVSWAGAATPSAAAILTTNFDSVYSSTGVFEIGITTGFYMLFTSSTTLLGYLPSAGLPASLTQNLVDPTSSSSGIFGGDVAALELNVDFADAGVTRGTAGVAFGDLLLCNFTSLPALNGMRMRDVLAMVNRLLGGGTATYSIAQLDQVTADLNIAFAGGTASTFAQEQIFAGACP